MYLYGDSRSSVHGWNAVDVRNSDGSLQHGKVINAVENGLIIDFDCPKQYSQFIEYGRIFDCSITADEYWETTNPKNGDDMQGLIRLRPDGPWIWLPGKLLEYFSIEYDNVLYGFVELQMDGGTVKELLPDSQIRLPPTTREMKKRSIKMDHFVVRSGALPTGYWGSMTSLGSDMFAVDLEDRYHVHPVHVLSETVIYLQRRDKDPLATYQLNWSFRYANKNPKAAVQRWLYRRELPQKPARKERQPCKAPELTFPPELLTEIFQQLNSVGRIRCRRTCRLWNAILTTECLFKDIIVSLNEPDFSSAPFSHWNPLYAVTGCTLKCFTQYTDTLVIMKMVAAYFDDTPILIKRFLEGRPTRRLVFSESEFGNEDHSMVEVVENIMQLYSGIIASCDLVLWRNCRVKIGDVLFIVPRASINLNAVDLKTVLWNLLESQMHAPDMQKVRNKIAYFKAESRVPTAVWVLNEFQMKDPRPNVHYSHFKWTAKNFKKLDLEKLTKTTLCQLEAYRT